MRSQLEEKELRTRASEEEVNEETALTVANRIIHPSISDRARRSDLTSPNGDKQPLACFQVEDKDAWHGWQAHANVEQHHSPESGLSSLRPVNINQTSFEGDQVDRRKQEYRDTSMYEQGLIEGLQRSDTR